MKIKNIFFNLGIVLLTLASSGCTDYLDVVPDKTSDIAMLFSRRETAFNALATCYHYLPVYECTYGLMSCSDEMIMTTDRVTDGKNVLLGKVSADTPIMSYWKGDAGESWAEFAPSEASMWIPIRICNIFLNNIQKVPDMTQSEKTRWTSEVKFLKAYYHFLLFSQYGPIPIMDQEVPIDDMGEMAFPEQQPVDTVVNYIVRLLDEAAAGLPQRVTNTTELGRIDQVIAKSMKAKVLLYAASPLFNNNPQYASFKNKSGVQLFTEGDDHVAREKWLKAAEAYKEALTQAENLGAKLYTYPEANFATNVDKDNYASHPERIPYMYNYQFATVDTWNPEVIWGCSRVMTDWHEVQRAANFKSKDESSTGDAWQWFGATINASEFFYTQNGLPMNEDTTFDYENRDKIVTIPSNYSDVAQEGEKTAYMFLGREPRFYASIGFDRSRVRGYGVLYDLKMRYQESNGRNSPTDIDTPSSGLFMRKLVHPDTKGDGTITRYAWPVLRYNEMLLSYAECLNEAYGTERQSEVLDILNRIRERSGVPTVQHSWAMAKDIDLYKTQEGMRTIIHQERTIELAFEGYRNDDVRRWLNGSVFNTHIYQWSAMEKDPEKYYQRVEDRQMLHVFTTRNYLWPIPTNELVRNPELVQTQGY